MNTRRRGRRSDGIYGRSGNGVNTTTLDAQFDVAAFEFKLGDILIN